ncbi:MAG: hypothetical protein L3K10_04490 [Thermoplasmata archaeon]|nr:hypothetical protein [Thermoplasmata archaeon]
MALLMGLILGPLFIPLTLTNLRLDALPTTALSGVLPGNSYKVYATVANGQSNVIVGSWGQTGNGANSWGWTAKNFWISEGGTRLFVNVSGLINVRQPGSAWGSQNGNVVYTAGTLIALYGPARSSSNGTSLFVQYAAQSPTAMGHVSGDLWPMVVAIVGGSSVVAAVSGVAWQAQRRQHRRAIALHPPSLPRAPPVPQGTNGRVTRYPNTDLQGLIRKSWWVTAITAPTVVLGGFLWFVNFFVGTFLVSMGGVFFVMSFFNRISYNKAATAVITDDNGILLPTLGPTTGSVDQFIPWGGLHNFHVYFGRILALRTNRGEFTLPYLAATAVSAASSELQSRGFSSTEDSVFHPLVGETPRLSPLRALGPSEWHDRLTVQSRRFSLSVATLMAVTVALVTLPAGVYLSSLSPVLGGVLLLIGATSGAVSAVLARQLRKLREIVPPGDEPIRI